MSEHALELGEIEASGIYSNYGPVNGRLERAMIETFWGEGECLTVCNATIGLMLALREVVGDARHGGRQFALMPSFTFAAAAQAALWCGLTPLFCDIETDTWLPSAKSEDELLKAYAGQIAVMVPCATFGNNLDLGRYAQLAKRTGIPVVVDAAASLGSLDAKGNGFGRGFEWPMVFSMHATKPFSVGEGGVVYCADAERIARLRCMGSFGFGQPRSATMIGLNSKMSEVTALTAHLQLERFPKLCEHRVELSRRYHARLGGSFGLQRTVGRRQVRAFESVLLSSELAPARDEIAHCLSERGIGSATYFSPHVARQPFFERNAEAGALPNTEDLSARILSLPLLAQMTLHEVDEVCATLLEITSPLGEPTVPMREKEVQPRLVLPMHAPVAAFEA